MAREETGGAKCPLLKISPIGPTLRGGASFAQSQRSPHACPRADGGACRRHVQGFIVWKQECAFPYVSCE